MITVDDYGEQRLTDTTPWMRTAWSQGIQTENDEFNNKAAKLVGVLAINCPESSIDETCWSTKGGMLTFWSVEKLTRVVRSK